jgi:hypothetical protein
MDKFMNLTLSIRQITHDGRDARRFRAYISNPNPGRPDGSTGITATSTGNPEHGALRCAAKAFIFLNPELFLKKLLPTLSNRKKDQVIREVEAQINLVSIGEGMWEAKLK